MHFCSHSLGMHDATLAHNRQVLADLCLALTCCLDQVFYRARPFTQQREKFQACWVGESLAEICLQAIELFFSFLVHFLDPSSVFIYIEACELMNIIPL